MNIEYSDIGDVMWSYSDGTIHRAEIDDLIKASETLDAIKKLLNKSNPSIEEIKELLK